MVPTILGLIPQSAMGCNWKVTVQQKTGQNPLLKDFTGEIVATSSGIYQNVCLYVQLQNPVDDIVADLVLTELRPLNRTYPV